MSVSLRTALLVGLLFALGAAGTAAGAYSGTSFQKRAIDNSAGPDRPQRMDNTLYLPLVVRQVPPVTSFNIYGRVTYNGLAAGGLMLDLRHWDGASYSTQATTATGSDGRYSFTGVPSLLSGHSYYVRYLNSGPAANPDYVSGWYNPDITPNNAGNSVAGGDFDIADVFLSTPANDHSSVLPIAFGWAKRIIASDTYAFGMFDLGTSQAWETTNLGSVDSFTLTALPQGANYGQPYGWYVLVFKNPDSYGASFYYREFTVTGVGLSDAIGEQLFKDKIRPRVRSTQREP